MTGSSGLADVLGGVGGGFIERIAHFIGFRLHLLIEFGNSKLFRGLFLFFTFIVKIFHIGLVLKMNGVGIVLLSFYYFVLCRFF